MNLFESEFEPIKEFFKIGYFDRER